MAMDKTEQGYRRVVRHLRKQDELRTKLHALVKQWRERQRTDRLTRWDFAAAELEQLLKTEGDDG